MSIVETNAPGWDYTIAGVNARVRFGNDPRSVSILNLEGYEGHHNPLTGEDLYTPDMERAASRAIFRPFLDAKPMANNLWVNTVEPAREHRFLSVLAAEPHGYPMPRIDFVDTRAVVISEADGSAAITVTFDPAIPGDIFIDVEAVRRHAQD